MSTIYAPIDPNNHGWREEIYPDVSRYPSLEALREFLKTYQYASIHYGIIENPENIEDERYLISDGTAQVWAERWHTDGERSEEDSYIVTRTGAGGTDEEVRALLEKIGGKVGDPHYPDEKGWVNEYEEGFEGSIGDAPEDF